jgi:multidrug efflux pump subunit AcrB
MQIARFAIERPLYTWILILFCLFGGVSGYIGVGKLEDPAFTLKSALVITPYPGATADEVATEVSEVLETHLQQMGEVENITSTNRPGVSVIEVEVRDMFDGGDLPQIWDDLRDRVGDAAADLPPGALVPIVNDSFGDVFGVLYAVSAPGYSDADIREIATFLRRELLAVPGVANTELRGLPQEAIFVEPSTAELVALGVTPSALFGAVSAADQVSPTGAVNLGRINLRTEAPVADDSVSEIGALTFGFGGEVLYLSDVASVSRGRVENPTEILRHNGVEAFTLGVAALSSENIISVGAAVEARLADLKTLLPAGVTIDPIYEQHRVVSDSTTAFLVNLATSVAVVIAVLALFMGWRAALIVGGTLLLNVIFTFFFMNLFDIKMERISLGALIIAMGMLVDNAIVIAEGMQVQMNRGRKAVDAAGEVARRTQLPLLGATVIGILAFSGIGLSPDSSGEFLFSLFAVIGISLLLSWLLAVTVTPLLASYLFKTDTDQSTKDPYDTVFFRTYGRLVRGVLRIRWLVLAGLAAAFVGGVGSMGQVRQEFFPPATTPLLYLNYMAAQGTSIHTVAEDLEIIEDWLLERPEVTDVTTTVGGPMTRFMLTYSPGDENPAYAQLVIRLTDNTLIPALREDLAPFAAQALPWAETRVQQTFFGPPVGADVEVRISGSDAVVLRQLAAQALRILENETDLLSVERTDWRDRELVTQPILAKDRAEALGITRADVAQAIALATDGVQAGVIREAERLIPIVIRTPRSEQVSGTEIYDQPLYSPITGEAVGLSQVVDGFNVIARDTLVQRRNRVPTISVQAFTVPGVLAPEAFAEVRGAIEAMDLPAGYNLEWGGEFESSATAQENLGQQLPLAFGAMFLITVLLFGKLRQTFVIWTVVPMALTGVGFGLLFTGMPFSFTALLGLLSLAGMLIKNAIVLVEEIDVLKDEDGLAQEDAIVTASISRMRPVLLAAATTILGMLPLISDGFFASMAVAIMGGLGFASVLTLVGVPAIYHTYLRRERLGKSAKGRSGKTRNNVDYPSAAQS